MGPAKIIVSLALSNSTISAALPALKIVWTATDQKFKIARNVRSFPIGQRIGTSACSSASQDTFRLRNHSSARNAIPPVLHVVGRTRQIASVVPRDIFTINYQENAKLQWGNTW